MHHAQLFALLLTFSATALMTPSALAALIHVPADQPTIQAGIDAASPHDTVLVSSGTYVESVTLSEKDLVIIGDTVGLSVILQPTLTTAEPNFEYVDWHKSRHRSDTLPLTVKLQDGDRGTTGFLFDGPLSRATQLVGFVLEQSLDAPAIFCSFASPTIRKNHLRDNTGGGIYLTGDGDALIADNHFTNNGPVYSGGAVAMLGAAADLVANVFENNRAYIGGAVFCDEEPSHVISGNTFMGNFASGGGGALYLYGGGPVSVFGNLFVADTSDHGGAIDNADRDYLLVMNNTFDQCVAGIGFGGGNACWWAQGASVGGAVINNIITNTAAANGQGGAIGCDPGIVGFLTVDFNCVSNNSPVDYFRQESGPNSLAADPQYCDAPSMDYHLSATSPCIGTGQGGDDRGAFGAGCDMPTIEIDVLPGYCPNYVALSGPSEIHVGRPKSIPSTPTVAVALLGSAEFDVTSAILGSLELARLTQVSSQLVDISSPVVSRESGECECSNWGPDGYVDLVMQFDQQDLIDKLGPANMGTSYPLHFTGLSTDGLQLSGTDCISFIDGFQPLRPTRALGPKTKRLRSGGPNPFNAATVIECHLEVPAHVELRIYDLLGRPIREITSGDMGSGVYRYTWTGIDDNNRPVASGIYFAHLSVDRDEEIAKIVLLK